MSPFSFGSFCTLKKKASGQYKADGYDLSVLSQSVGAPGHRFKSAGRDHCDGRATDTRPENKCGSLWAGMHRQDNDTPALNALKALRGAPISMGRGEIPVELSQQSSVFACFIFG